MNQQKFAITKVLILVTLIFLIVILIACSNAGQKDIDKDSTIAAENLETEETEKQKSDLESNDSDISKLCYNPYVPLKPGVVWTYEILHTGQSEATEFTVSQEKVDSDTFIVTQSFPGNNSEYTWKWKCTGDGIIQDEYAGVKSSNMPEGIEFNTIEFKGVTYPPADEWQIGKIWSMDYTISSQTDTESGKPTYEGHVIIDNEIAAMESVEVPAGIYKDALRVDTIFKEDGGYEIQGISQDINIDLEIATWYVKDVGWVKQVSGPENANSTTVLLSME